MAIWSPPCHERVPVRCADEHDPLERGAFGSDLADHRLVVTGLERRGGDEQLHARLVEHVGQLVGPVRRVDVDEDRPDLGGGVLQQHPLGAVRRPDADAVAGLDPGGEQAAGQAIDIGAELVVGPSPISRAVDQGLTIAEAGDGPAQILTDRASDERLVRGPARVGLLERLHVNPLRPSVASPYARCMGTISDAWRPESRPFNSGTARRGPCRSRPSGSAAPSASAPRPARPTRRSRRRDRRRCGRAARRRCARPRPAGRHAPGS